MDKISCISEKPKKPGISPNQSIALFLKEHDIVLEYLLAMLDDCYTLLHLNRCAHYASDRKTVRTRFAHEGLSFATKTLPQFFDNVLTYLETGHSDFPGFKIQRGKTYPAFLQQLVKPIVTNPDGSDTPQYLRALYQLCVAFKKLKGPYREGVLAEELRKFKKVDLELPDECEVLKLEWARDVIVIATNYVTKVCEGFNPFDQKFHDTCVPGPGPGATNTPTEKHERFRPHVHYTSLQNVFPYDEWFSMKHEPIQSHRWDLRVGKRWRQQLSKAEAPTSRFKFVFKTYGKPRCICIEELEMQWLQQAVRKGLYKTIRTHPLTSGYVEFNDQSINATLALQSSIDRKLATIDMSSASDRVTRWLVSRLFSGNAPLHQALMTLSTRIITFPLVPGKVYPAWIEAKKFAPMGSALCFPVMGLVHWALISAIVFLYGDPQKDEHVWVYGDDIILPSRHVQKVYELLPVFGMKLNTEKSFVNSLFRESCGTHAYKGVDITPTRFKTVVKSPPSNEDLISALQNEGDLYKKGFKRTASLIRSQVLNYKTFGAHKFPTVSRKSCILGWIRDDDALLDIDLTMYKKRWNDDHQQCQYKVKYLHQTEAKSPLLDDVDGYLRSFLQNTKEDAKYVGGNSTGLQIRRKWLTFPEMLGVSTEKYFRLVQDNPVCGARTLMVTIPQTQC